LSSTAYVSWYSITYLDKPCSDRAVQHILELTATSL